MMKNPIWNTDPVVTARHLANSLNAFFTFLNQNLTSGARERVYSDGFISVLLSLHKLEVVHLQRRPLPSDLEKFLNPLAKYLNEISDDEASRMRKGLASAAGRVDMRNGFVKYLQQSYDKDFGIGLITNQPTLAEQINKLELDLNSLTDQYLTHRYGAKWFLHQKVFSDTMERNKILERAKLRKTEPWEHLNFLTTINSLITTNQIWQDQFEDIFREAGIYSREEAKLFARKLWDYRTNKLGHDRATPVIYSKEEEDLIRSIYHMFRKIITIGDKIVTNAGLDVSVNYFL